MAPKFDYTRLLVRDFASCYRFYRDVVGLPPTFGTEEDNYAEFHTGATRIALYEATDMAAALGEPVPPPEPGGDTCCLIFGVDDVDAAWAAMTAAGGRGVAGPVDRPDWDVRTAHLRDPDGRLVEINARL